MDADLINRFWAKVEIRAPGECWRWTGALDDSGYGRFQTTGRFGSALAHRMAYALAKGEPPSELDVLHSCDAPPCCNPNHLWVGTALDNVRDAVAKGRFLTGSSPGSKNGNARLTESDVLQIRERSAAGATKVA